MGSKKIEAYSYYKQQYPDTLIFFRVGDYYEAYQEDAATVGALLGMQALNEDDLIKIVVPVREIFDFVAVLATYNIITKLISRRDESGGFDIPDIDKIKYDQEIDY